MRTEPTPWATGVNAPTVDVTTRRNLDVTANSAPGLWPSARHSGTVAAQPQVRAQRLWRPAADRGAGEPDPHLFSQRPVLCVPESGIERPSRPEIAWSRDETRRDPRRVGPRSVWPPVWFGVARADTRKVVKTQLLGSICQPNSTGGGTRN